MDPDGDGYTGLASKDGTEWRTIGVIDGPARSLPDSLYAGFLAGSDSNRDMRVVPEDIAIEAE